MMKNGARPYLAGGLPSGWRRCGYLTLLLGIVAALAGCATTHTVPMKAEFEFSLVPEEMRPVTLGLYVDDNTRAFAIQETKGLRTYRVPVGQILEQAAYEALRISFRDVAPTTSMSGAGSEFAGTLQLAFGPGSKLEVGNTTLSAQKATIDLRAALRDTAGNTLWETAIVEQREGRKTGTALAGAMVGGAIGGGMTQVAMDKAMESAANEALVAALERLVVQLENCFEGGELKSPIPEAPPPGEGVSGGFVATAAPAEGSEAAPSGAYEPSATAGPGDPSLRPADPPKFEFGLGVRSTYDDIDNPGLIDGPRLIVRAPLVGGALTLEANVFYHSFTNPEYSDLVATVVTIADMGDMSAGFQLPFGVEQLGVTALADLSPKPRQATWWTAPHAYAGLEFDMVARYYATANDDYDGLNDPVNLESAGTVLQFPLVMGVGFDLHHRQLLAFRTAFYSRLALEEAPNYDPSKNNEATGMVLDPNWTVAFDLLLGF